MGCGHELRRRRPDAAADPGSPFAVHLGTSVVELDDGRAVLAMPFPEELVRLGRTVHGGALATLLDATAMAAARCGAAEPERLQGSTISLSAGYLAPADAVDLVAEGRVLRRRRWPTSRCPRTGSAARSPRRWSPTSSVDARAGLPGRPGPRG